MTTTTISLSIAIALLFFINQKLKHKIDTKDAMLLNQQKDFQLMIIEQKNIMSLNKMCIEKWERSVLDNSNLQQTNYQLLQLVDQHNKETQ